MLEIDQRMEIFNLSDLNNSSQVILTKTIGQGSFNQTSKSTKVVLASLAVPLENEDNSSTIAIEEYLLNDTIFIKANCNWTQMRLPTANLWTSQNKAGQQLELLNNSNITYLGIETIDGELL